MTELIVICDKLHINYHLSSINYHLLSVIYRLSAIQKSFDVFEYTFSDIASIFFHKFLTGDVFEQFDVAVTDALYDSRSHFRYFLTVFALETVFHQPFANEFFRKLFLRLAFFETFLITFRVEIAA